MLGQYLQRRHHVRCRKCDKRRVLRRHPEQYAVRYLPKCECGAKDWRVDWWMMRRNTRLMGCTCAGYVWAGNMSGAMHRRGSLRCYYRSDGSSREYGDSDYYIDPDWENEGGLICIGTPELSV
jgi:hypothetical protein